MPRWDTYPENLTPATSDHLILPDSDELTTIAAVGSALSLESPPTGGATGTILQKDTATDYDYSWTAAAVPTGGTTGQVLAKQSATDLDVGWDDAVTNGLPAGGTTGQVIVKDSATDYDVSWSSAAATHWEVSFTIPGTLVVGDSTFRYYVSDTITGLVQRASVGTAPTGASAIFDVYKNGTTSAATINTTSTNRPTIVAGAFTDTGTPDTSSLASGDYIVIGVAQIGSTIAGADAVVTLTGTVS